MGTLNQTPNSERLQITLFGRRNAGKSSLINALANQSVALVSAEPGTTTDPVIKAMELLPLGPIVLIDTAGIDDHGTLGELRVKRTYEVLNRTDLALLVLDATTGVSEFETEILKDLQTKKIPVVGVVNKSDLENYTKAELSSWEQNLSLPLIEVSALNKTGISTLKTAIIKAAAAVEPEISLVGDLIQPGDLVVLVIPIDSAAPKGRLILPQQQVLRDLLDHDAIGIVTKETELKATLASLSRPPALVITDSQAFERVSAETPLEVPLTSFSILQARYKGDLSKLIAGTTAIQNLKPGDRVLIAEGCTHHRQKDDIGTVKLPRWLQNYIGGELHFEWSSGMEIPENLAEFKLIIHCGACMLNRRAMLQRIEQATTAGVPIVNYGVLIAALQGILPRVISPIPEAKIPNQGVI